MKKIEKVNFSEGSIGKSGSGDNCVLEEPSQVELLLEQIADIAELIDGPSVRDQESGLSYHCQGPAYCKSGESDKG